MYFNKPRGSFCLLSPPFLTYTVPFCIMERRRGLMAKCDLLKALCTHFKIQHSQCISVAKLESRNERQKMLINTTRRETRV